MSGDWYSLSLSASSYSSALSMARSGEVTSPFQLTIATLTKFPLGAWFPFMVGILMTMFMSFWRWGMTKKRHFEWDRRVRMAELLRRDGEIPMTKGVGEGAFVLGRYDTSEK